MAEDSYVVRGKNPLESGVSEAGLEAMLDIPGLESKFLQLSRKLIEDLSEAVNRNRQDIDELFRDVNKLFQSFHEAVDRNREDLERLISRGRSERKLPGRERDLEERVLDLERLVERRLGRERRLDRERGLDRE